MFSDVAILGPGLLGGSLALALKKKGVRVRLWARREEAVAELIDRQVVETASTALGEIVKGAELVVLATPVGVMADLTSRFLPLTGTGRCLVTDVGSVKASVCDQLGRLCRETSDVEFIGSHPMAGSENAGLDHARADLFEGAACIVTPEASTCSEALATLTGFWKSLGCQVTALAPAEHDKRIAAVSHLPHLAASLTAMTALHRDPSWSAQAGAGLRDTIRVAGGDPAMWTEILLENREALLPVLADLEARCGEVLAILEQGDEIALRRFLDAAKQLRDGSASL